MTLLDRWDNFVNSYIKRSKSRSPQKAEEELPFKADEYSEEFTRFSFIVDGKRLTPELRRRMALTAPYYMSGLRKKCHDTFRSGFGFKRKDGKRPSDLEQKELDDFNNRNNILKFLSLMKQDAHIYGDGLALVLYVNDQRIDKPDYSKKPRKGAEPYKLKRLNPEFFEEWGYKSQYWKKQNIQHLIYENKKTGEKYYFHPDRVKQFKETDFAFSKFGISDMDILRNIISSFADVDKATGEILKNFSYGILNWTKEGAKRNEIKEMKKIADKHPHIYVGNEKYKLEAHSPEAIDPEHFFNYMIGAVAAVLVMPIDTLLGKDKDDAVGIDYNNDIRDSQKLVYAPPLVDIYKELFIAKFSNNIFDYEIDWNPIYVGETAEAELDGKRSAFLVNLKTAGIIDNEESRRYLNDGKIFLNPNKKIEQPIKIKEPVQPNPRTEQAVPKKDETDKSADNKLKNIKANMLMNKRAIRERELGETEMALQEYRLFEAEIKKVRDAVKEKRDEDE